MLEINIDSIDTEKINQNTLHLDECNSLEIAQLFNQEDKKIAEAVEKQLPQIAKIIDLATTALTNHGRIVYLGAGNSGRLAAGDACECIPTFGVEPNTVIYVLAGGKNALMQANEGAEDDTKQSIIDLNEVNLNAKDLVIGLSASGRTPYVKSGLDYAKSIGCRTASIACSHNAAISQSVDVSVEVLVGPEAITGSTRLKAGTAQKMILNMISSGTMINIGKVYGNLMVDVSIKNDKLYERAKKIIKEITHVSDQEAKIYLEKSHGKVKPAILMIKKNLTYEQSIELLKQDSHLKAHI